MMRKANNNETAGASSPPPTIVTVTGISPPTSSSSKSTKHFILLALILLVSLETYHQTYHSFVPQMLHLQVTVADTDITQSEEETEDNPSITDNPPLKLKKRGLTKIDDDYDASESSIKTPVAAVQNASSPTPTPAPKTMMMTGLGPNGRFSYPAPTLPPIRIPPSLQSAISSQQQNPIERNIILVHVGKTGGMTIRQNMATGCYDSYPLNRDDDDASKPQNKAQRIACLNKFATDPTQRLGNQIQTTIHMFDGIQSKKEVHDDTATTYLFTLRNPIDRAISTYRYTHPANCHPNVRNKNGNVIPTNFGCTLIQQGWMVPGTSEYKMWKECFPSPAMETFAQSLLPPYPSLQNDDGIISSQQQQETTCSQMARNVITGKEAYHQTIPHLFYNYQYYINNTITRGGGGRQQRQQSKDTTKKEVYGIRTELLNHDLLLLDKLIGSGGHNGKFKMCINNHYSHGSEVYAPSPLSKQAKYKLCCLLHKEIDAYLELYDISINLDFWDKQQAQNKLQQQCGFSFTTTTTTTTAEAPVSVVVVGDEDDVVVQQQQQQLNYEDWKTKCQQQIRMTDSIQPGY